MTILVVQRCALQSNKIVALESDEPRKARLFKSVSSKFIRLNNFCDSKSKISRMNRLIRSTNTQLHTRFEPLIDDYKDKTDRLMSIIFMFCQMKCLDMYFQSESSEYNREDKSSFYDFLITLNQTVDEFIDDIED